MYDGADPASGSRDAGRSAIAGDLALAEMLASLGLPRPIRAEARDSALRGRNGPGSLHGRSQVSAKCLWR